MAKSPTGQITRVLEVVSREEDPKFLTWYYKRAKFRLKGTKGRAVSINYLRKKDPVALCLTVAANVVEKVSSWGMALYVDALQQYEAFAQSIRKQLLLINAHA